MAEVTSLPVVCCSEGEQQTCCDGSDKPDCCSDAHPEPCGCSLDATHRVQGKRGAEPIPLAAL